MHCKLSALTWGMCSMFWNTWVRTIGIKQQTLPMLLACLAGLYSRLQWAALGPCAIRNPPSAQVDWAAICIGMKSILRSTQAGPGPAVAEAQCVLQALEAVAAKEPILVRQCLEKRQASHIHQQLCDRLLTACAVHAAGSCPLQAAA